jgi:hypothetical protein
MGSGKNSYFFFLIPISFILEKTSSTHCCGLVLPMGCIISNTVVEGEPVTGRGMFECCRPNPTPRPRAVSPPSDEYPPTPPPLNLKLRQLIEENSIPNTPAPNQKSIYKHLCPICFFHCKSRPFLTCIHVIAICQ